METQHGKIQRSERLWDITQETLDILSDGGYELDGQEIMLPESEEYSFADAEFITEVESAAREPKDGPARIILTNAGAFEAAAEAARAGRRVGVHSFGGATEPAPGLRSGSVAQEAQLCRQSTLYDSISSSAADIFYATNRKEDGALYPDNMLYSPHVAVFRDSKMNLLREPYVVSVFTVPAPDLYGRASIFSRTVPYKVMQNRLARMLGAAANRGVSTLVLGAWGCGERGHDPHVVAELTRDVLEDGPYLEYFDEIIIAVPGCDERASGLAAFREAFPNAPVRLVDCDGLEDISVPETCRPAGYTLLKGRFPKCNYTESVDQYNLGHTRGVLSDGTPFVAEKFVSQINFETGEPTAIALAVMIPCSEDLVSGDPAVHAGKKGENPLQVPGTNVVGYHTTGETSDQGVLSIGMFDLGDEGDLGTTIDFVNQLENAGIIVFTSSSENGLVLYCYDADTEMVLARIMVTLWEDGETLAVTTLDFEKFPERDHGNIVYLDPKRKKGPHPND